MPLCMGCLRGVEDSLGSAPFSIPGLITPLAEVDPGLHSPGSNISFSTAGSNARRSSSPDRGLMATFRIWSVEFKRKVIDGVA